MKLIIYPYDSLLKYTLLIKQLLYFYKNIVTTLSRYYFGMTESTQYTYFTWKHCLPKC